MSNRPELSRIEFSCSLFSRMVMERICDVLAGVTDLGDQIRVVQRTVAREIPYVQDAYAQLRYARAIVELLETEIPQAPRSVEGHPIWKSVLCELAFLGLLRHGEDPEALLSGPLDTLELAALCRALLCSSAVPSAAAILGRAGVTVHVDALIRDLLRDKRDAIGAEAIADELAGRIHEEKPGSDRWILFCGMLAENRVPLLEAGQLERMLKSAAADARSAGVLLKLIGECGYDALLPSVHDLLTASVEASGLESPGVKAAGMWTSGLESPGVKAAGADAPRIALACLDAAGRIGSMDSLDRLEQLVSECEKRRLPGYAALIGRCARVVMRGIRLRLHKQGGSTEYAGSAPVLVQVVLNDNPQTVGSASVGGVLTFLHSIGDALGRSGSFDRVITLEVLPWNVTAPDTRLESAGRGCHTVIRAPVHALPDGDARRLMIHESDIRGCVASALRMRGIVPDLFHVRYTNNLAKAVVDLTEEMGRRLVFTLTADPHRDFTDTEGRLQPMSEEQTLSNLNKVFIADRILEQAHGILGIAHGSVDAQLLTYFPKLCLSPQVQAKPVRVIPEGIRLNVPASESGDLNAGGDPGTGELRAMLFEHAGTFALKRRYADRPLILNVGRLVPGKGQQRLVEAWAGSVLSETYNLVLIGGNLQAPNAEEREMLDRIEQILRRHPYLAGRFCHLASLDNTVIRRLESELARGPAEGVPVYLCSSLKEEFGIAILEAMAAGFLALAPVRGGVRTYIEQGRSGYLIDTSTAASIRREAERMLLSESGERLRAVAMEGKRFILDNFGIHKIAGRFADFYHRVLAVNEPGGSVEDRTASRNGGEDG